MFFLFIMGLMDTKVDNFLHCSGMFFGWLYWLIEHNDYKKEKIIFIFNTLSLICIFYITFVNEILNF